MKLKIACVQLNPVIGSVKENTERAHKLLETLFAASAAGSVNQRQQPDLIIFPELALTGYNFPNKDSITPYLENFKMGHSSKFASDISRKYLCYTVIGYPEFDSLNGKIYNSVVVSDPIGEFIHNYRKSHLYETDEVWGCEESPQGFRSFELKFNDKIVRSSIGICMDLNPYKFEAPFNLFEFATHCLQDKVELILCPMLWLQHGSPSIQEGWTKFEKLTKLKEISRIFQNKQLHDEFNLKQQGSTKLGIDPDLPAGGLELTKPDVTNVNYWILRFFPFLNYSNLPQSTLKPAVVLCNRSGLEDDVMYAGSSSILKFQDKQTNLEYHDSRNDSVEVLGYLGQGVEGVLVRDVEI